MKLTITALAFLMLGITGISNANADPRRHHHGFRTSVGVVIGPYWGPWYYPAPTYYYPPVIIERTPPPVYIEQPSAQITPLPYEAQTSYWYYCRAEDAYYPYVKECPAGWQKVLPRPPNKP